MHLETFTSPIVMPDAQRYARSSKELGGAEILAEGNAEYRKACRNV